MTSTSPNQPSLKKRFEKIGQPDKSGNSKNMKRCKHKQQKITDDEMFLKKLAEAFSNKKGNMSFELGSEVDIPSCPASL